MAVFIVLFFVTAPYGRHTRRGWGAVIPNWLGWFIMEAPSALAFAIYFILNGRQHTITLWVFFLLWEAHYIHRAFIYPFMIRGGKKKMPASVTSMAFFFNLVNAYLNGRWLFALSDGRYAAEWLLDARFIIGAVMYVAGFVINRWADAKLRMLRAPGEHDYRVPTGGLYRWISSPNYFGEMVEWFGWAIMTWSLAGLTFAVWTFANLAPRAVANHKWYHDTFDDYPEGRKALVPLVW